MGGTASDKHRLNWDDDTGIYKDKSFSYCNGAKTTIEKSQDEVSLFVEPATPGCCVCCIFCGTPFIVFSPCMLSCILCNLTANSLSFQRRAIDEGKITFSYREKGFCSSQSPVVLRGARSIRMSGELRTNVTTDDDGNERVSHSTVIHFEVDHESGSYSLKEMHGLTLAEARNFCNDANFFMGVVIQQPLVHATHCVTVDQSSYNTGGNRHMLAAAPPMVGGTYTFTTQLGEQPAPLQQTYNQPPPPYDQHQQLNPMYEQYGEAVTAVPVAVAVAAEVQPATQTHIKR